METSKAKQIWAQACEFLSSAMSADVFQRWIGVIEAVGDESTGQLTLAVPNGFYQDWLEEHYLPLIQKAIAAAGAENVAITFMVVATVVLYLGCARLLVSGRGMRT